MERVPAPTPLENGSMDELFTEYMALLNQYNECRVKHEELRTWSLELSRED